MCGIAGYFLLTDCNVADAHQQLKAMGEAILHRGPDDGGVWTNADASVGFSHRRLSIVDLSAAGHQPMVSASKRFTIVFNGEIYNHNDLRKLLEDEGVNYPWNGHSDTETLLACFEQWGIGLTVERCIGMFAFGVWDSLERSLTLGRDRLGEKPLFYGWQNNVFLFGSELKSLKAHKAFENTIDKKAFSLFIRLGYIPAPHAIYRNIKKLKPGCLLKLTSENAEPVISSYWSLEEAVQKAKAKGWEGSPDEAVSQLESLLKDAISRQMLADVPLGAFLSGGVDSSTIVALMQAQSSRPVKTFTIGFDDKRYNEAEYAKDVARHLQTDHTELYISSQEALDVIPLLSKMYDEPFADTSQIPTYLVAKLAKTQVTVSLSGDAGDELFCGYNRYTSTDKFWSKISPLPAGLRKGIGNAITSISPGTYDKLFRPLASKVPHIGSKLHKGASFFTSTTANDLYLSILSQHPDPDSVLTGLQEPSGKLVHFPDDADGLNNIEHLMLNDMLMYLPDDILVKVDRASMAVSLESRVPFLDHRIIEYAWSLPLSLKLNNGVSKAILRNVLYKYVPSSLIERPKMGFGIPIGSWLRGPLKNWAEALLSEENLKRTGLFNVLKVRAIWADHQSKSSAYEKFLWNILMFLSWLEQNNVNL